MIRVKKYGYNQTPLSGACENCGCEIECIEVDTNSAVKGQDMSPVNFVHCPTCGNPIYVVKEKA